MIVFPRVPDPEDVECIDCSRSLANRKGSLPRPVESQTVLASRYRCEGSPEQIVELRRFQVGMAVVSQMRDHFKLEHVIHKPERGGAKADSDRV